MSKIQGILKKAGYFIFLFLATLAVLEMGIRISGYAEGDIYDPIYMPYDNSKGIPYILKPNLIHAHARGRVYINTDQLGLRSLKSGIIYGSKKDKEIRIAILGDSVTFGDGVEKTEDVFPQVVEDELKTNRRFQEVHVFNFGVCAYSVKEMVATLKYRVLGLRPDLVIMAIIPDDFNISRTPSVDKWGYTSNKKMSGFCQKDSFIKRILRNVRLTYLFRDIRYQIINRGGNGAINTGIPDSYKFITQFRDIANGQKLPYMVLLLPTANERFDPIMQKMADDKINYIDLSYLSHQFTLNQFMASRFNAHPSAMVHKQIGEILADRILRNYHFTN